MGSRTQTLAVLFADISDSTKLYATLGDSAARKVVNDCLSVVAGLVDLHQGRVVKTIGDELLAVFTTADAAVLAASGIQSQISAPQPGKYPAQIHVGLHYGPVLVEDNDIFGDTVNAAAYLTAVASAEQILTTESTERHLSATLKSCVRPVFKAVLKGSSAESTVYQVIWHQDTAHLTDVNLGSQKVIPGDEGSLMLVHNNLTLRLDQGRATMTIGRGDECDLIVREKFASRQHMSIRLMRTHFYLVDHSINGTFVSLESGQEVHVLRAELLLDGSGRISLGRSLRDGATEVITYARDRRSMYRVA